MKIMQKRDIILIIVFVAVILIAAKSVFSVLNIKFLIKILAGLLILSLFLYKQIKAHKNALYPKYKKWFSSIEAIYDNVFNVFTVKTVKLGDRLSFDYTSLLVLIVLIIVLII
jgi:hypothetical protein